MRKDYGAVWGLISVALIVIGFVLMLLNGCVRHYGEASWTLQGEHSLLGCPGQHVETVQADNQVFFLGCYGEK